VLGSTVAHHNSVGAGRGDVSTISPLLTASLGAELDHLTDQLTLTWAAGADGLELEPSGGELLGGGGCEIHVVSVCVVSLQGQGVSDHPSRRFPNRHAGSGGHRNRRRPSGRRAHSPHRSGRTGSRSCRKRRKWLPWLKSFG